MSTSQVKKGQTPRPHWWEARLQELERRAGMREPLFGSPLPGDAEIGKIARRSRHKYAYHLVEPVLEFDDIDNSVPW